MSPAFRREREQFCSFSTDARYRTRQKFSGSYSLFVIVPAAGDRSHVRSRRPKKSTHTLSRPSAFSSSATTTRTSKGDTTAQRSEGICVRIAERKRRQTRRAHQEADCTIPIATRNYTAQGQGGTQSSQPPYLTCFSEYTPAFPLTAFPASTHVLLRQNRLDKVVLGCKLQTAYDT